MNAPKPTQQDPLLTALWDKAVAPALVLLPQAMSSPGAWQMLIAISLQEARATHRVQIIDGGGRGPARGLWQFERGGGVIGVLNHKVSRAHAWKICEALQVPAHSQAVWAAMEHNDVLAGAFARLLLWTDPNPLPHRDAAEAGWQYYIRNWRPGKPHRHTWDEFWVRSRRFVYGS